MMASFASVTALLLLAGLHSSSADILPKSMDEISLPSGEEWMSLSKSVDFMPAPTQDSPMLRNAQKRLLNYYKDDFADGLETQYNEYAQAWRYLGLYMDCDYVAQNQRRRLDQEAQDEAQDDGTICKRYLLWGAVSLAFGIPSLRETRDQATNALISLSSLLLSMLTWTTKETDSLSI